MFCKESSSKKDPLKQFSESLQLLVDSEDDDVKMKFLCEQFSLQQRSLNNRRYSASLLSVSLLIFSHSPSAYRAILEEDILCLPSERTLKRMTSKLSLTSEESNFNYFEKRIESLNSYDKHVLLIIDEIYVASKIELFAGNFFGSSSNGIAKTLLCFIVSSLGESYEDIVSTVPFSILTSQ